MGDCGKCVVLLAAFILGMWYGPASNEDSVPVQTLASAEAREGFTTVYASAVNSTDGYEYRELAGDGSDILLCNNDSAVDPTYAQLMQFLQADATDQIPYRHGTYVCADYAKDVHDHAELAGMKAGWVGVDFADVSRHACNVFHTVDRGTVYIDCTGQQNPHMNYDCFVNLVQGAEYTPVYLFEDNFESSAMGRVNNYIIYW